MQPVAPHSRGAAGTSDTTAPVLPGPRESLHGLAQGLQRVVTAVLPLVDGHETATRNAAAAVERDRLAAYEREEAAAALHEALPPARPPAPRKDPRPLVRAPAGSR